MWGLMKLRSIVFASVCLTLAGFAHAADRTVMLPIKDVLESAEFQEKVGSDVKFYFGGMRNEVFGEDCCLTTHRLVKNSPEVVLYSHPHCSGSVRCADFTALIKHYKFCGDYLAREKRLRGAGVWWDKEIGQRMDYLNSVDEPIICVSEFHLYTDIELLFDLGFLVASDRYLSCSGLSFHGGAARVADGR